MYLKNNDTFQPLRLHRPISSRTPRSFAHTSADDGDEPPASKGLTGETDRHTLVLCLATAHCGCILLTLTGRFDAYQGR
jgi:hypothetical protein